MPSLEADEADEADFGVSLQAPWRCRGAVRSQGDAMGGGPSYHGGRRAEGVAKRAVLKRDSLE